MLNTHRIKVASVCCNEVSVMVKPLHDTEKFTIWITGDIWTESIVLRFRPQFICRKKVDVKLFQCICQLLWFPGTMGKRVHTTRLLPLQREPVTACQCGYDPHKLVLSTLKHRHRVSVRGKFTANRFCMKRSFRDL